MYIDGFFVSVLTFKQFLHVWLLMLVIITLCHSSCYPSFADLLVSFPFLVASLAFFPIFSCLISFPIVSGIAQFVLLSPSPSSSLSDSIGAITVSREICPFSRRFVLFCFHICLTLFLNSPVAGGFFFLVNFCSAPFFSKIHTFNEISFIDACVHSLALDGSLIVG